MNWSRAWFLLEGIKALARGRQGPLVSPRLGWSVATLVILAWSALCAAVYGLVLLVGNWAITGASYGAVWNVQLVEFITATLSVLQGVGHVAVAAAWAMVSLAILGVTWFVTSYGLNGRR